MALELYMVGVMVKDMPKAVEFYRRLGLAVPEGSESKVFVEVKMSGLTFFLNSRPDPLRVEPSGGYRILLEFYLETQAAVETKYNEMIESGYASYAPPFKNTAANIYFALINDPDGNTILLSGEPAEDLKPTEERNQSL